ncbi:MAG: hypothetical protein GYB68_04785 [Chloroflexi bacterium]|nr:hypothetical protein [Chloroflexota bacterium]
MAINATIPERSPVLDRVLFVGESFFIPIFLINIGLLINPTVFLTDTRTILISAVLIATIFGTKLVASRLTGLIFNYSVNARLTMGGAFTGAGGSYVGGHAGGC